MATEREIERARALRRNATNAEAKLWARLRSHQLDGAKFRRQVPIAGYIADFACASARLVIEIDGGQHGEGRRDAARTAAIEGAGYIVVRFWNNDVLCNIDGVLAEIHANLDIVRK